MSTPANTIDLSQRPPRSPRVRLGGYVLLPRILDKARASAAGKLGEYHYSGKGMDRHFFNFVGLDHESLKTEAAKGLGDYEMLQWVQTHSKHKREAWEIAAWSHFHENRVPDSDFETMPEFAAEVATFNKNREDIHTWFALLDLDDYCSFGGKA